MTRQRQTIFSEQTDSDQLDLEGLEAWRSSPLAFVYAMWGLEPQPIDEEYFDLAQSAIDRGAWDEFKAEWFLEFEKGVHITWQQWMIFLAVERAIRGLGSKRISVSSGHGTGKDASLAMLILWYLLCFEDAQIPCTAPSSDQMYDVLWKEVAKWLHKMPEDAQAYYEWGVQYVRNVISPETWFARAKTARKEAPEALAGMHGDNVFMAVDEASGVAEEIYNTAEGALTSKDVLVLLISNPTRIDGYFYDSHHEKCSKCAARWSNATGVGHWKGGDVECEHEVLKAAQWQRMTFNSEESPIVDWDYIERIAAKHGRDSDEYKIRVLGLFPDEDAADDDNYVPLIGREDLKEIADKGAFRKGYTRLGVDPSAAGMNKTEWVLRDKFRAKIVATEDKSDRYSIAKKTLYLMDTYGIPDEEVTIDGFGVGIEAVQELALQGVNVLAINTGDGCDDPDDHARFVNIRAMISWRAREWIKRSSELVRNKKWQQCVAIKYRRQLSGKIKVMDKMEMRKRGIQSPDAWDAFSLTFVRPDDYEARVHHSDDPNAANDATKIYSHHQRE